MKKRLAGFLVYLSLSLAVLMMISPMLPTFAQVVDEPPTDPCPGGSPCDPDVPITGIEWLLLSGGLFGASRVYKKFRRKGRV